MHSKDESTESALLSEQLSTRADVQRLAMRLLNPVFAKASAGGARISLGATGARYQQAAAEMEGCLRPFWGLAPLMAGGAGQHEFAARAVQAIANGTDPRHPEFWGALANYDQRFVEFTPLVVALRLAPQLFWEPLSAAERQNFVNYLNTINDRQLPDNNWLFFRVLVNLVLSSLGASANANQLQEDLRRLDLFYLGDGWYSDGPNEQRDYYVAFAFHFYALLYCRFAHEENPIQSEQFADRARAFAKDFIHWFAADGGCVPYGRSLTYRFAQAAFWGALALANVEALPWGVVKGLWLRNIRWWLGRPILNEAGLLSIGYAYPNMNIAEDYNSPASPYWACKAFLPLALPKEHPFWLATELELPALPALVAQPHPRLLFCRDRTSDHVVALAGGQWTKSQPRHVAEKYAKFCYSSYFGFSVPSASSGLRTTAHDCTLALSEEGLYFRVRRKSTIVELSERLVHCKWRPWPDVLVDTWLVPAGLWHVRLHRIRARRKLLSAEGGFALPRGEHEHLTIRNRPAANRSFALCRSEYGVCVVADLFQTRRCSIVRPSPNTNVLHPRTLIPTAVGRHEPGAFWLAAAVLGDPRRLHDDELLQSIPSCTKTPTGFQIADGTGAVLTDIVP